MLVTIPFWILVMWPVGMIFFILGGIALDLENGWAKGRPTTWTWWEQRYKLTPRDLMSFIGLSIFSPLVICLCLIQWVIVVWVKLERSKFWTTPIFKEKNRGW